MFSQLFAHARDDRRVRRRFERVETRLSQHEMTNLPPNLQAARAMMLANLRQYYRQGIFPRNYDHRGHRPAFIDKNGRVCAVAYLMIQSGHENLAKYISTTTNDAYVRDIDLPEFDDWAAHSGLSKEELAFIQPSYYCTFHPEQYPYFVYHLNGILIGLLNLMYLAASIGIFSWILNGIAVLRRRCNTLAIGLGVMASIALVMLGVIQYQAIQTNATEIQYFLNIKNGLILAPDLTHSGPERYCTQTRMRDSIIAAMQQVLPQNPTTFRNMLIGLGIMSLLFCFLPPVNLLLLGLFKVHPKEEGVKNP